METRYFLPARPRSVVVVDLKNIFQPCGPPIEIDTIDAEKREGKVISFCITVIAIPLSLTHFIPFGVVFVQPHPGPLLMG